MNLNDIFIRPAIITDVVPMTTLSYRTIRRKYPPIIGSETVEAYVESGEVLTYYRERLEFTRVAEVAGRPVGACALMDNQVHLMMVDVDHHRSGIGAFLLRDGERALFSRFDRIELESFRDNAQAVGFYTKHGWHITDHFDMPDHGIPMVRMAKERPAQ